MKKEEIIDKFNNFKTIEEKENFVIFNLYGNGYTYTDLSYIFECDVYDWVVYFEKLNIKYCSKCNELHPRSFFFPNNNSRSLDKLRSSCRIQKNYKEDKKIKILDVLIEFNPFKSILKQEKILFELYKNNMTYKQISSLFNEDLKTIINFFKNNNKKRCCVCKKLKFFDEFSGKGLYKHTLDGFDYTCKECQRNYTKMFANFSLNKKLKTFEDVRRDPNNNESIQVRCLYCNKWFNPTNQQVQKRLNSFNGKSKGENRFYCSDICKQECPSYGKKLYPKGFRKATSREVQPALRKLVFERDDWTCQKCGNLEQLHCHHLTGVEKNPIESADIDNCITLCKKCHKEVHKLPNCSYIDFRCKK